jgi:alpha-L-arabinofuranosidase
MGVMTRPIAVWLVALAGLTPHWGAAQDGAKALIVLHVDVGADSVSPLIFGANHRGAASPGDGADPETGLTYPLTVEQIKDVGVSLISYPAGALTNSFQWQRAVGPRMRRAPQVRGPTDTSAPLDSGFGPDEFGDLLDQTGAVGMLMVNFGTASAADAADYVAYMSAPVGSALVNGMDWASRRAANRHPKPYRIAYVDIGNDDGSSEQSLPDQDSWINGEPVSINASCAADRIACLYAFGGSTRFECQPAVQLSDWREPASVSDGKPSQTMYARYAPVAAGSETVFVDGAPWQGLSDLSAAAADAKAYRINYLSGAISFGDGMHGAIPAKGRKIAVSYTSGPHEGFVDFYRTIKAVNPNIKVCASLREESFIRIMSAHHAYDCIQQHPYVAPADPHAAGGGLDDYLVFMASKTMDSGAGVRRTRELVKKYAGANAARVEMGLSEYGQLSTYSALAPHFERGAGEAVISALWLRECVVAGVTVATRKSLTEPTTEPRSLSPAAVPIRNASPPEDLALFAGPGPDTIVTPAALTMKLLRQYTGATLVASSVEGSPKLSASQGVSIDGLQAYATRDAPGNIYLVVINVDPQHDVKATVRSDAASFGPMAEVTALAPHELSDENNPKKPGSISLSKENVMVGSGTTELTFPKHSVTGIKLTAAK